MEVFATKKRKRIFWIYMVVSFSIFIWSCFSLTGLDKIDNGFPFTSIRGLYYDNFYSAHFFVLIPVTYIVVFSIMVMKWNQYRAHKERYQSFLELDKKEQQDLLANVFCKKCTAYHQATFSHEKMIDGMRWVYCKCSECGAENKIRLS